MIDFRSVILLMIEMITVVNIIMIINTNKTVTIYKSINNVIV